ncbi:MAG: UDP-N-acetylmuramoyl-L-alanine--D-glutamate ligase [Chloroflexi bacterium]|nr:UDP-N-acetylmuramoyl-L-alanine--D-glutamate ligase [Chloroflexota bacterium]
MSAPERSTAQVEPVDLDRLTLDSFEGRPVAVLGLARSGIALARFLADRGAWVTAYDARPAADLTDAIAQLGGRSIELQLGPEADPVEVLRDQALVATSPSVSSRFPTTEPRLRSALGALEAEGRVPVISEVDLFLRLCPARTVGVTGTKGKTTTSSLIAAVLERGRAPVLLGGNIGTPLVERLPELTPQHLVVVELSELQLPTLSRGTDIAVYTHVTADHLDRHGDLDAYRTVKRLLARLVPTAGGLVLNDEDPVSQAWDQGSAGRVVRYGRTAPTAGGVGVEHGWIVADGVAPLGGGSRMAGRVLPLDAIPLPGWHSVSNVAAAVATGLLCGIDPIAIREGVEAFRGVEHRLETVLELDGVRFINDSQGTQPDAVIAALRAFPAPTVLICGGRAKGVDLGDLPAVVAERAVAAVLIGESGPDLGAAFRAAGLTVTERAGDMTDAVARATRLARAAREERPDRGSDAPPATVLLSPAAASFDMFRDYEARGRAFKDAVRQLAGQGVLARAAGDAPRSSEPGDA